jgi:hypothetical protein
MAISEFQKKIKFFFEKCFSQKTGEFETEYSFTKIFYKKWRKLATKRIVDKFQILISHQLIIN